MSQQKLKDLSRPNQSSQKSKGDRDIQEISDKFLATLVGGLGQYKSQVEDDKDALEVWL